MLKSWGQKKALKICAQIIPSGNTRQQSRAGIQSFLLSRWMRSHGGLMSKMILKRRSRLFWSLSKIRDNFGVSGWCKQRGDGFVNLEKSRTTMILTQEVLDRYRANQGYVYLIHAVGTDRYKIGRSINPPVRLETLKKQSPYPLQIIECFWSPDAIADERFFHQHTWLSSKRAFGEWFELSSKERSHKPSGSSEIELLREDIFGYCRPTIDIHVKACHQHLTGYSRLLKNYVDADGNDDLAYFLKTPFYRVTTIDRFLKILDFTFNYLPKQIDCCVTESDAMSRIVACCDSASYLLFGEECDTNV
jgi:hypothetical protein